jgi:hypothetical protein
LSHDGRCSRLAGGFGFGSFGGWNGRLGSGGGGGYGGGSGGLGGVSSSCYSSSCRSDGGRLGVVHRRGGSGGRRFALSLGHVFAVLDVVAGR